MSDELCPRCGVVRNLILSTSEDKLTDQAGKMILIITKTYHCESCHSFVRSEIEKVPVLQ